MNWIRQLFSRRRLYGDLSEEIQEHLEEKIHELVAAGMSREDAAHAARREFGNVTLLEERSREVWQWPSIESFFMDVRYGLRTLRKNPGFTTVAVLTLALGIGANTAMFSVVDEVLLRSMPYKDPDRLVMIWETYQQFPKVWASVPNFNDWQAQNEVFDAIGAYRLGAGSDEFTLTGHGEPERIQGTFVSANLFGLLGVRSALGRIFVPAEDKPGAGPIVLLSHALWQRLFASDPHVIGRNIILNDKTYTVVGVMPPRFQFPHWAALWMPLGQMGKNELTSRVYHPLEVVARLKPGVALTRAQAQINTIAGRLGQEYPKTNGGWGITLVPLREELLGSVQPALLILLGATGLVLLIACANVANLMLARASAREKEMAVRAALGAGRTRLMRQLLCESVVLSSMGGALGLVIAFWGRDLIVRFSPSIVPHLEDTAVSGPVLAFSAVISILTGLVFGLVPAFMSSSVHLTESLKQGARSGGASHRQSRFRNSFVIMQVALALILVVGAALLIKSFVRLVGVDPGFDPDNVLTARIDLSESRHRNLGRFYEHLSDRLKALPGVEAVGMINHLPLGPDSAYKTRFIAEGSPLSSPGAFPVAELRLIDPDYFRAMGIPLVKGRNFRSWGEEQQLANIIINETMARRFFPHEDSLGKRLDLSPALPRRSWVSIVGVVGDVRDSEWPMNHRTISTLTPPTPECTSYCEPLLTL